MVKILIINGPNLNLLGTREPELYGYETLQEIEERCRTHGHMLSIAVECRQSNHEGQLIDWVHAARTQADGLIINAGGYSHTSIALLDALKTLSIPIVEVHLSNIYRREAFRHHSYVSQAASGMVCGLGWRGYLTALEWLGVRLS